ncbi:replication initiation protein [Vibrio parahaemolyticus]|uniref:replication initiation protein n=1 Tax=Vibrio parahaemolyticus TaxID=670 RepID=UPI000A1E1063|nr:replication initiation protein [Vibrio parahaemolyticus]
MMKELSVYKANDLIDASYRLNTQAQKLILSCLAKLDSRHDIPKQMTLTAAEFSELMGIDPKNAHRELYKAADALFKSSVILRTDDEETEIHWIQKRVVKLRGEGAVTLTWSDDVVQYISQLQSRFTGYKVRNIALLQSPHSIRMYELLMRFKATGERTIQLEHFKSALGISGKYQQFKILNRDVLKKAVDELNKRSDLSVAYEPIRKGRKVTGLAFSFTQSN